MKLLDWWRHSYDDPIDTSWCKQPQSQSRCNVRWLSFAAGWASRIRGRAVVLAHTATRRPTFVRKSRRVTCAQQASPGRTWRDGNAYRAYTYSVLQDRVNSCRSFWSWRQKRNRVKSYKHVLFVWVRQQNISKVACGHTSVGWLLIAIQLLAADARTCLPNIILWQLVLDYFYMSWYRKCRRLWSCNF